MAMTAAVKDELSRVDVPKPCCRRAEMAALLRFAGGLHIVSGRVVVEAELDTGAVARRLRREIADVYGYPSEMHVLASGGLRKGSHYIVRMVKDGEALARQTGLLDVRGRPVRGLPPHVVSANVCCAVAAWRGAFMAHGSLTEPGRSSALEITCPGPGGGAGAGRRRPPDRHHGQGARGPRRRPGGHQGRRRDRRPAHPDRRPLQRAGLGGAPGPPRGPGHRQPAGQLRRRQPAPLGPGRGGRRPPGSTRALEILGRRGAQPPDLAPASCAWSTGRPRWRSWARSPTRR